MTQGTPNQASAREQYAALLKYRATLEGLMITGRYLLSAESLGDELAPAYQGLVENTLETAGQEDLLDAVDGVTDSSAKIELIMQDIIQPQLTTTAQIEQQLAEKAAAEESSGVMLTGDTTMTTSRDAVALESLTEQLGELTQYQTGLEALLATASMEGITPDHLRPMVGYFLKQIPDITQRLKISVEDVEATQVLGEMTEAVEKISQAVAGAREVAEAKVSEARAANDEQTSAGAAGDFTEALLNKTREENPSGVQLDEGTKVTTTSDEGTAVVEGEATEGGEEAGAGEGVEGGELTGDDTGTGETSETDATVTEGEAAADDTTTEGDGETTEGEGDGEEGKGDGEEEEEDDKNVSTENLGEPTLIFSMADQGDLDDVQKPLLIEIVAALLVWLNTWGMLSEKGKAQYDATNGAVGDDFVLTTDMLTPSAADLLTKYFGTWCQACQDTGVADTRPLDVLAHH